MHSLYFDQVILFWIKYSSAGTSLYLIKNITTWSRYNSCIVLFTIKYFLVLKCVQYTNLHAPQQHTVRCLYFATAFFTRFLSEIFINFKTQWQFWNLLFMRIPKHPYMLNLMKFWLRYLRLKTVDIFQKIILSSSFSLSIVSVNSSANS